MRKFVIGMLVSNQSGVLTRISGMFSRRGFNIDSLTVGVTENPDLSRMTVTMTGSEYERDQMVKQLDKLFVFFIRYISREWICRHPVATFTEYLYAIYIKGK